MTATSSPGVHSPDKHTIHGATKSIRLVALALAWSLGTATGLPGEPSPDRAPPMDFWDEIPASPSTTPPREIKDDYWHGQFQRVNREVAAADRPEIIFFGDSITWHWSLGAATGREVWDKHYVPHHPINMGNSGDITPVMLYRTTNGNLDFASGHEPKVAVLLCGTNNFVVQQSAGGAVRWDLGPDCPPKDVAAGVRAIAQTFRRYLPRTRVLVLGILPVAKQEKWTKCREVNAINAKCTYPNDEVVFLDLQDRFLQPDGTINKRLFTDGTHLTKEGYQVWADSIAPVVAEMTKAPPLDPVQIMLIGDSVTEGVKSSESYRRYLDGMLRRQGHFIDFVGSRRSHHNNSTKPDCYQFDPDHEGHWGKDSGWLAENMPGLLDGQRPDVAVLHIGTEDIIAGNPAAPGPLTSNTVQNIGRVISSLRASNPGVKIVLSKVLPMPGKDEAVSMLNRNIARFAKTQSTERSPIVVADLPAGIDASADLANDGGLPNEDGARKMAETFSEVIHTLIAP